MEEKERVCPCPALLKAQDDIDKVSERGYETAINFSGMNVKIDGIATAIINIQTDVSILKAKPGIRWESTTTMVRNWCILIVLGYIAIKLGVSPQ
jgi:hypothetical protein